MNENYINNNLKNNEKYKEGFLHGIEKCLGLINYHENKFSIVYNKTDITALKDAKIWMEAMKDRVLEGENPDSSSDLM